jgi:hypothetical protein
MSSRGEPAAGKNSKREKTEKTKYTNKLDWMAAAGGRRPSRVALFC